METNESRRRFVRLLAAWAMAPPGDRQAIRALNDPLQEFHPWARALVKNHYWYSLNTLWGATPVEFIDECIRKVLVWAKNHGELLMQLEFTDNRLRGAINRIARNHCLTLGRRLQRRRHSSLDTPAGNRHIENLIDENAQDTASGSLGGETCGRWVLDHPDFQREFTRAQLLMPAFGKSLSGEAKMRQTLGAILRFARTQVMRERPAAYAYARRILKTRYTHLPEDLRKYLQDRFQDVDYKVINGRLGYLRREFAKFHL